MVWQGYLLQFRKARTAMDELRDDPSVQNHPSKLKKEKKSHSEPPVLDDLPFADASAQCVYGIDRDV